MWTSSYALLMGGWALICFAAFYWIIDVKGRAGWTTPLTIFGMNAITLYVLSELLATLLEVITTGMAGGGPVSLHAKVYSLLFAPFFGPANASLAYAIAFVAAMFAVGVVMWRKKWFLRV